MHVPRANVSNPIAFIFPESRTAPSTIAPTHPLFRAAVESSSPQIPDRIDPPAAAISTSSALHESTAISSSSYGFGSTCAMSAHNVVFARPTNTGVVPDVRLNCTRGD